MSRHPSSAAPLVATVRGFGERVVCLHGSAGSGSQWRALQDAMADCWEVLTPDLYGHGRSPAWPAAQVPALHVDADAVARAADIGPHRGVHLVGHGYGAAVALQVALHHPAAVRSLTMYEPLPFGLLRRHAAGSAALGEIEGIAASLRTLTDLNRLEDAARIFAGYWGGPRAWDALHPDHRRAIVARMPAVALQWAALFAADWSLHALDRLVMPVLLMQGSATRAPAARLADLLAAAMPQAQRATLPGAGHLGPLTHRDTVAQWMLLHVDPRLAGVSV